MTIAVSVKVHDGLVIASDSALTMVRGGDKILTVYNHGNKIFNLHKDLPLAGMFWGVGNINHSSISTLTKDLRRRFAGEDSAHKDWHLNRDSFTIEAVAQKTRQFLYEELYQPFYENNPQKPDMGFMVGGYSANESLPEVWHINIINGECLKPELISGKEDVGIKWDGEPEALNRLLLGRPGSMLSALLDYDPNKTIAEVISLINHLDQYASASIYQAPMPIKDAIDLAEWLVHTSIMWSRFTPDPPTVGGPIEIAAITKHEGFKWIKRKYYFDRQLNPGGGGSYEAEGTIRIDSGA